MRVFVFTKAPRAGTAKTRLSPPLTPEQSLDVHIALLLDTWECCREQHANTSLLCVGHDADALGAFIGSRDLVVGHRGTGLAEGLRNTMLDFLPGGPVAICASDVPGVKPGTLQHVEWLLGDGADVVLGPGFDGGWWLIALNQFTDVPFSEDIPWSTPATFSATVVRCRAAGLRVETLEPWPDVDTVGDLSDLLWRIDELPGERTRALLRTLAADGTIRPERGAQIMRSEIIDEAERAAVLDDEILDASGNLRRSVYMAVPRAVAVVVLVDNSQTLLSAAYRHPVRERVLGVPWWYLGDSETSERTAQRELKETLNAAATRLEHVGTFYAAPDLASVRFDVLIAHDCQLVGGDLPAGFDLHDIDHALRLARDGRIPDGPSALGLLLAERHLSTRDDVLVQARASDQARQPSVPPHRPSHGVCAPVQGPNAPSL